MKNDPCKNRSYLIGLLLCIAVRLSAQTIFLHDEGLGIVDRALIVPPEQFGRSNVEQLARQFLSAYSRGHLILRLTMGTDKTTLAASLYHGSASDTVESTIADIRRYGKPKGPVAQLLAVGDDARLSYLDGGAYSEQQLAGSKNPSKFQVQEITYKLLHFKLIKMGASLGPNPFYLHLFFKASPNVSIGSCVSLTRQLQQLTKVGDLSVSFRPDSWFLEDQDYPLIYPFVHNIVLPGETYILGPKAACTAGRLGIRCSGQNFLP